MLDKNSQPTQFGLSKADNTNIPELTAYYDMRRCQVELPMNPMRSLMTGVLLAASAVAAAADCSDYAGDWVGTYSETDCFGDLYSGDWTAVVTSSCVFTGGSDFETIDGTIDPLTGILTASAPTPECGIVSLNATFQNNSMTGTYTYSFGGSGTVSGNKLIVDTDGDGDPDATDPDDDNDGIGDVLDDQPLVWSNFCTSSDGDNATLGELIVADRTCAARVSIDVLGTTQVMGSPAYLHLIAPTVTFQSGVAVVGGLTVVSAHPCPACSP
ncbi:MAG: hypothetical protein GY949_17510 [Gammaproteobacteria bacterium]|nr:hypothetical protein [Gammaproteobacteria bacterium]